MEEGKIGFALTPSSSKSLLDATLPSSSMNTNANVIVYEILIWIALALMAGGLAALWYFVLYPALEKQWPLNSYYVLGCSTAYFFVVVLLLGYGIRPLLMLALKASPQSGRIATPEN